MITAAVATGLVAEQFPAWAHLAVTPVALDGWDNTTFRLGDRLSIRLPSHDRYVPQIEKEHRWLPYLAPRLPVPIPEPRALGRPTGAFPRPWSIYGWIDGDAGVADPRVDLRAFATDLAAFLVALRAVDARDGPPPGEHSAFRGGPLRHYDRQTRSSIAVLGDAIDGAAATEVWDAALASSWDRPPVWVHGDVAASNLLVRDGRLAAVIDFGCAAVGDPACDLVIAWTLFSGESRDGFVRSVGLDASTWARARGWALWKALITLAHHRQGGPDPDVAARRNGWRCSTADVVAAVLAEAA